MRGDPFELQADNFELEDQDLFEEGFEADGFESDPFLDESADADDFLQRARQWLSNLRSRPGAQRAQVTGQILWELARPIIGGPQPPLPPGTVVPTPPPRPPPVVQMGAEYERWRNNERQRLRQMGANIPDRFDEGLDELASYTAASADEADAEAFAGAMVPMVLQPLAQRFPHLRRATPALVHGAATAARVLRRTPGMRRMVGVLPGALLGTARRLAQTPRRTVTHRVVNEQLVRQLSSALAHARGGQ